MSTTVPTAAPSVVPAPSPAPSPAASVTVRDLRISLMKVQSFDLVSLTDAFAFLGARSLWVTNHEKLREKGLDSREPMQLPWKTRRHDHFWTRYLNFANLADVPGGVAWRALAPVRLRLSVRRGESPPHRLYAEGFVYPGAVAVVLTYRFRGAADARAIGDLVVSALRTSGVTIELDGQTIIGARAETIVDQLLGSLTATVAGAGASAPARPITPFSVATVVRGQLPAGAAAEVKNKALEHRFLQMLITRHTRWLEDEPEDLETRKLGLGRRSINAVLYSMRRGRSVWFPASFLAGSGPRMHTLSCFHRNLLFASLQTEVLAHLVVGANDLVRAGTIGRMRPPLQDCARLAAVALSRLYSGSSTTYRSASPKAHVDQNDWQPALDSVRTYFGLTAV